MITVRRAEVGDAAIVALLGRLTFRETFAHLYAQHEDELSAYLDHTFSVAKITSSLSKSQNRYWLAFFDDLPVGYAKLKYRSANALIEEPSSGQLQKIYVLSEFIAHRIGHALIEVCMNWAVAADAKTMWLTVLDTNDRAIRFYERQGWNRIGKSKFSIGTQDFSFLVMATQIVSARETQKTMSR